MLLLVPPLIPRIRSLWSTGPSQPPTPRNLPHKLTPRYGAAVKSANKKSDGLYDTTNDKKKSPLGGSKGLRQYYRYGLYSESLRSRELW